MVAGVMPLQVLKVVRASAWEAMAIGEPTSVVVATPGGKPVMALPGDKQIAPVMTVKPEFVIVEEALTPQSFEFAPRVRAIALGANRKPRASTTGSMIGDILRNKRTEGLAFGERLSAAVNKIPGAVSRMDWISRVGRWW